MRIVGGRWAGAQIVSPGGRVRPTTEDLRAAWFEALDQDLRGARVLDLFAGTGALGLEALSRGAQSVDFVENGPGALHALRANVARFRAKANTRIFVKDAVAFIDGVPELAYDLALADPPYTSSLAARLVERWREGPFAAVLAVEHSSDVVLSGHAPAGRAGAGAFTILRVGPPRGSSEPSRYASRAARPSPIRGSDDPNPPAPPRHRRSSRGRRRA